MCDHDPARRWFLGAVGAAAVGAVAGLSIDELASGQVGEPEPTTTTEPLFGGLQIRPRASWGADLPPKGPLSAEDSRFILIHHTASPNDGRDPRQLVRATYGYHAGPKGWPDICYNFMVGHDGSVWEARAGSLAGPIVADATGGSQGYGQLICDRRLLQRHSPTGDARRRHRPHGVHRPSRLDRSVRRRDRRVHVEGQRQVPGGYTDARPHGVRSP
jgi:hypothetical protein